MTAQSICLIPECLGMFFLVILHSLNEHANVSFHLLWRAEILRQLFYIAIWNSSLIHRKAPWGPALRAAGNSPQADTVGQLQLLLSTRPGQSSSHSWPHAVKCIQLYTLHPTLPSPSPSHVDMALSTLDGAIIPWKVSRTPCSASTHKCKQQQPQPSVMPGAAG